MIVLLSPAKSLDYESALPNLPVTEPRFTDDTLELVKLLRTKSADDLSELMSISEKLGTLNADRYRDFSASYTDDNSRPALLAFTGDVYQGLNAKELPVELLVVAQERVRILSGLYGLLRPLDLIQPYRLEMGIKLQTARGKNLYEFWGSKLTRQLNEDLDESGGDFVVNLASQEYFGAIKKAGLKSPVVTPVFRDEKNGQFKIISFYAKKARGLMTRFILQNEVGSVDQLRDFSEGGYRLNEAASAGDELVFERAEADRE